VFHRNIVTRGLDGDVRKLNVSNASWRNWVCRQLFKIISGSDVVGCIKTSPDKTVENILVNKANLVHNFS